MKIYSILRAARDMGADRKHAISCRERYLTGEKLRMNFEIQDLMNSQCECKVDAYFTVRDALGNIDKIKKIDRELREIYRLRETDRLTDEQVERAKNYPVDKLIEFRHGKARAWCHDDKNPSLFHGTRKNLAVCPVCNKSFNAISILMDRDGYTFIEAVKQLSEEGV